MPCATVRARAGPGSRAEPGDVFQATTIQESVDGLRHDPDVPLVAAEGLGKLGATMARHLIEDERDEVAIAGSRLRRHRAARRRGLGEQVIAGMEGAADPKAAFGRAPRDFIVAPRVVPPRRKRCRVEHHPTVGGLR